MPLDVLLKAFTVGWGSITSYLTLFLVSFIVFINLYSRRTPNLPPGPWNPLFFISLIRKTNKYILLTETAKKFGPMYSFRAGPALTIVLNNFKLIKEALVTKAEEFSLRPYVPVIAEVIGLKGSVFRQNGKPWKTMRKIALQAFRKFGVGKKTMEDKIQTEARFLSVAFADKNGQLFDPKEALSFAVSNIICSITFGSRFDYDDKNFLNILHALDFIAKSGSPAGSFQFLPFKVHRYFSKMNEVGDAIRKVKQLVKDIVKEHRDTFQESDIRDITDVFIAEEKKWANDPSMEEIFVPESAVGFFWDLLIAGSETTVHTLSWGLLLFCIHPEIQEKVYQEMKEYMNETDLPVTVESMPCLPYTVATMNEIQRFRPVVPLTVRWLDHSTTVGNFTIPAKSRVLFNMWSAFHDPNEWENPEEFNPSRFLSENGKSVVKNEALITFGMGNRICVGENLAKMEIYVFLTDLITRFRFYIPESEVVPDLDGIQGVTLAPKKFKLCAELR